MHYSPSEVKGAGGGANQFDTIYNTEAVCEYFVSSLCSVFVRPDKKRRTRHLRGIFLTASDWTDVSKPTSKGEVRKVA